MIARIKPSHISGSIISQPSKSSMQRAVAASLLCNGLSVISNISDAADSQSALAMAECLGATIQRDGDTLLINGGLKPVCRKLNCGESGLGVRLFSAIASLCEEEIFISGNGSILKRPMSMIEDSLSKLGAKVQSASGFLPLSIQGPIHGGRYEIDGSLSSQLISGLLFALPLLREDTLLIIDSLKSRPYIDLTISVLESFGVEIDNRDYREIFIRGGQKYLPARYRVEEDWSGISFITVLGAVSNKLTVKGLSLNSVQSDRVIIDLLHRAGAKVEARDNEVTVSPGNLKPFEFDISDCPDLAPPLTALAAYCKGKSVLMGTARLVAKESNRSDALRKEFSKLGVKIDIRKDSMVIHGAGRINSAEVDSHSDHRIAMALTIAASRAEGEVVINGADAVSKSYPGFFDDVAKLGLEVELINKI
jgi:3-phosphoshikimate 1-carboxyvinyltransferase